ncbi:MAG: TetR/AcrR family transcriptional regulator [bacterium]|jgi:AcrR family transcriptional regulator
MSEQGPGRPCDPRIAEQRREEIIRAAIKHFSQSGFQNADLDAIATEAGCAKGTLYRYFENKKDLFLKVVDYVMQGLLCTTTSTQDDDPLIKVEQGIRAYLAYFDTHPEYIELLIQERSEFKDRPKPTYFEYQDVSREHWRDVVQTLMKQGRFRKMPMDRVFDIIGNLLYGTIFTNYFAGRKKSLEEQADDILDVMLKGLLTPQAAKNYQKRNHFCHLTK